MRLLKIPAFGVFSDAVKTVEVEERFSSVCISLSQFWAVGLQLSEVPSLLSSSSSSNATSLLSFDKGAKFDDALWEEEGPPWGSSSLTSSLQKEIMAVLFSVSLPFFRFCSGNIAILSLLLRFLFYSHKEIFISLQCCLCMFISRRPGRLCRPNGCMTSTAPLTGQDLRLLSLGGWERRSYSIIVVRYNIILSTCASKSLTSPLEYPIT